MINYPFTEADSQRAYEEWHANCGPNALAMCLGITLDAVRPHLGDFEAKRYMSPTMMRRAVYTAGASISRELDCSIKSREPWPEHGLVRVQWTGPWTVPGANPKWAYRQTHWVCARQVERQAVMVFDVNGGWRSLGSWMREIVPLITASIKRADGGWYVTHAWEVRSNG